MHSFDATLIPFSLLEHALIFSASINSQAGYAVPFSCKHSTLSASVTLHDEVVLYVYFRTHISIYILVSDYATLYQDFGNIGYPQRPRLATTTDFVNVGLQVFSKTFFELDITSLQLHSM